MEQKIVLTGIARSKGKAAGEALVNRQRMGGRSTTSATRTASS